jgi:hypothetical protein
MAMIALTQETGRLVLRGARMVCNFYRTWTVMPSAWQRFTAFARRRVRIMIMLHVGMPAAVVTLAATKVPLL